MPYQEQELARLSDQIAGLRENLSQLSTQVARLETRHEIFAPFPWVHELITPLKNALAELSQAVAVLAKDDAHLAERMAEVAEDLDGLVQTIQKISEAQAHQAQQMELQEKISEKMAQIQEKVSEVKEAAKPLWRQKFDSCRECCKGFVEMGTYIGLFIYFLIVWAYPVLSAALEVILRRVNSQ